MSPQPNDTPAQAPAPTAVSLCEAIVDRWGHPYHLRGRIAPTGGEFTILDQTERPVARIALVVERLVGRLTQLHVADESAAWLPSPLKRPLQHLLPGWTATGHRGRGLGSLLVIYALNTACSLGLTRVTVAPPLSPAAGALLRDLGFVLESEPAGVGATYHILTPTPP